LNAAGVVLAAVSAILAAVVILGSRSGEQVDQTPESGVEAFAQERGGRFVESLDPSPPVGPPPSVLESPVERAQVAPEPTLADPAASPSVAAPPVSLPPPLPPPGPPVDPTIWPGFGAPPQSFGAHRFQDLADPTVLVDGGTHYVYGTTNSALLPVYRVDNLDGVIVYRVPEANAMATFPPWAVNSGGLWAPAVARFGDVYVMYFTGQLPSSQVQDADNDRCIGRATADNPYGPFVPDPTPFTCGTGPSGALDPSVFTDVDGTRWLLYTQGSSELEPGLAEQDIWSIRLDDVGNPAAWPVNIFRRPTWGARHIAENPSMAFVDGAYVLTFSEGRWGEGSYSTGVTICAGPAGGCFETKGPWLVSSAGREGPGGLELFRGVDGRLRGLLHSYEQGRVRPQSARHTHSVIIGS